MGGSSSFMAASVRDAVKRHRDFAFLALLSIALSAAFFFTDGNVGINLADEGYLWYGMRALKAGLVPIRDFHAYDPGRYVWTALWSCLVGNGLVSMRFSCVVFQCIGMTCGLLAARRVTSNRLFLVLIAMVLVQWMIPTYKVFEQSIALIAVWVAVMLIERPTVKRHFAAGLFVGIAAFMGRNHGLYNAVAFGLIILVLARDAWKEFLPRLGAWSGGVVLGYLPQLALFAFVPGYLDSFLALLHQNISIGSNLATQIPWPWTASWESGWVIGLNELVEGSFYLLLPVFVLSALAWLLLRPLETLRRNAAFFAATCVVLPYAHHTFSRADYVHLAHSVPVLALGVIFFCHALWPSRSAALIATVVLCGTSFAATFVHGGLYAELSAPPGVFLERRVLGQTMHVGIYHDRLLTLADYVANTLAKPHESVVFLPHWPGLYPATNRFSPTKQIYFIRPASVAEEEATLAELKAKDVRWAMLQDYKLDGRDDLRFRNTNPLVFAYFSEYFDRFAVPGVPRDTVILRRK
jgi:hypothetical protein